MQPTRDGTMWLYMVSSNGDLLSASRPAPVVGLTPNVPTTQGRCLEVRHSLLGMPGREGHALWSEQAGCLFLHTSKIGQQPDCIVRCSHDQSHQPRHWSRWQAHSRGMGMPPPQGPLLLLWPDHRLACPRLSQLSTPQTSCSRSHHIHHHG